MTAPRQKWEFMRYSHPPGQEESVMATINAYGQLGWELVDITTAGARFRDFYFKRPIADGP